MKDIMLNKTCFYNKIVIILISILIYLYERIQYEIFKLIQHFFKIYRIYNVRKILMILWYSLSRKKDVKLIIMILNDIDSNWNIDF